MEKNTIRDGTNNIVRFLGESVADRRLAMLHMNLCWRSKGGNFGV